MARGCNHVASNAARALAADPPRNGDGGVANPDKDVVKGVKEGLRGE